MFRESVFEEDAVVIVASKDTEATGLGILLLRVSGRLVIDDLE